MKGAANNKRFPASPFWVVAASLGASLATAGATLWLAGPPLPAGEGITILLLSLGMGLLVGWLLLGYWRRRTGQQQDRLSALEGRLQLIHAGDANIYLDYPWQDEATPLVETVNTLNSRMGEMSRRLQNERSKADYILDNMDSGLLLIDSGLVVRQCNTSAYKYFNFAEELEGIPVGTIDVSPLFAKAVEDAVKNEISSVLDLDLTDSSGVIVSARINPITGSWVGSDGGISAVVILQNVTQARQMERMRSEFVANVSHELKTPITSIMGFAELLQAGVVSDPKTVEEYMGRIHGEAERMTYLIEDILRLSSLEGKNTRERHEPVELAPLCEDIFFSLTPQLTAKGITTEVRGRAVYYAYPDDMRQLLKNLIENAIKYNVQGGSVTIRLAENAYHCSVTVADTGIGIPIEHQPRIFERFYRVDKGRSKREGGTGLGLSIVKHVVAKYRGQLTLTSKVDVGTTIKATLPTAGGREEE